MNNKGFTLIEVLCVIFLISIFFFGSFMVINNTFSITNEKAYEIVKEDIITQTKTYINECDNNIINCPNDYKWVSDNDNMITNINLSILKKYKYFNTDNFINPITNKDISNCLNIIVIKNKYSNIEVNLDDSKC